MTLYGYATLTPAMEAKLAELVRGRTVFDFGCGRGELAEWMARHKAKEVTAIDKDAAPKFRSKRIKLVRACIGETPLPDSIDVGVISWPVNRPTEGLVDALRRCQTVVYIGCNDETTACGSPDLFPYLLTRELDACLWAWQNRMLVIGKPLPEGQTREPTGEEADGIAQWGQAHSRYALWSRTIEGA